MTGFPTVFDPNDPVDAIADEVRKGVTEVIMRQIELSCAYRDASPADQALGTLSGLMVGSCGTFIASMAAKDAETCALLRSTILEGLPYWFDRALELNRLPPLGALQ